MKKIICFALTGVMAAGAICGLAGCGKDKASSPESLSEALAAYEFSGVEFTCNGNEMRNGTNYLMSAKGAVTVSEAGFALDFNESMKNGDSDWRYQLTYIRDWSIYSSRKSYAEFSDVAVGEYDKLLVIYRDVNSGYSLKKESLAGDGFAAQWPQIYSLYHTAFHALSLLGGTVTEEGEGYAFTLTLADALAELGGRAMSLLETAQPTDTVETILKNSEVREILNTVAGSVLAKDIVELFPSEWRFPYAKAGETAMEYIDRLVKDEAFAQHILGDSNINSLAELTIDDLARMIDRDMTGRDLINEAKEYVNNAMAENGLGKMIFGENDATLSATLKFTFNKSLEPTNAAFSMDYAYDRGLNGYKYTCDFQASAVFKDNVQLTDISNCNGVRSETAF